MDTWTMKKCGCGDKVCRSYRISAQDAVGFKEEDARLVVAAPDLLDALESTRGWWSRNAPSDVYAVFDKAIAKAREGR